jgi:dTMP kinase
VIGGAGVVLVIMSLVRDFILAAGLAALVGLCAGMAWIIGYTLIGHEVEDRLRGRIFSFVLSSVRIMLLLTIAVGPVLAGALGEHSIAVGDESRLRFSGPGLTLFIGGVLALLVSYYAASRATRSRTRLRDIARRRVLRSAMGRRQDHQGVFISVDGVDPVATAGYTAMLVAALHAHDVAVAVTAEPTDSPVGRRVSELLWGTPSTDEVEPETAALLSAADRAEHVATTIRPALDRGEVVVCDRYVLTSLAVHGGGRGADVDRIRSINAWSTGALLPDLTLVVASAELSPQDDETYAVQATMLEAADADPDTYIVCPVDVPDVLPDEVQQRLQRLLRTRASAIAPPQPAPGEITAR